MAGKVNHMFESRYWYDPKRDGTLDQYLRAQFNHSGTFRQFKGVTQFRMLWKEGYLRLGSVIRLMYNVGRGDGHYFVVDKDTLEGITETGAHPGEPGRHKVGDVLNRNAPSFEAQHLQEDPEKRKQFIRDHGRLSRSS